MLGTLRTDLRQLINCADFSDVVFLVQSSPSAHRAFLAVRCDHFRAMFSNGCGRASSEITIPSIRFPVFMALLEYVYTDEVAPSMTAEIAVELYAAADLYTLARLKALCEAAVRAEISVENCAALFAVSHDMCAADVRSVPPLPGGPL